MIGILLKKRVSAKVIEVVLLSLMGLFGLSVVAIFFKAIKISNPDPIIIILELLLLLIISVLGLTFVAVKVWEQHTIPHYLHKNTHELVYSKVKKAKKRKKRK